MPRTPPRRAEPLRRAPCNFNTSRKLPNRNKVWFESTGVSHRLWLTPWDCSPQFAPQTPCSVVLFASWKEALLDLASPISATLWRTLVLCTPPLLRVPHRCCPNRSDAHAHRIFRGSQFLFLCFVGSSL